MSLHELHDQLQTFTTHPLVTPEKVIFLKTICYVIVKDNIKNTSLILILSIKRVCGVQLKSSSSESGCVCPLVHHYLPVKTKQSPQISFKKSVLQHKPVTPPQTELLSLRKEGELIQN